MRDINFKLSPEDILGEKLVDKLQKLNVAISEAVVGGTGENKDQLLPLVFGECFNITPLLLSEPETAITRQNPAIYQIHTGTVANTSGIERIVEVPIEVIREVIKEITIEVPVEVIKEVIVEKKGKSKTVTKEVIKEVPVEKIVEVVREIVNNDEIDRLMKENEKLKTDLDNITNSLSKLGKGRLMKNSDMSSLYDE
jgi:hypothetical protein